MVDFYPIVWSDKKLTGYETQPEFNNAFILHPFNSLGASRV